jgi:hypothetical protein
MKTSFCLLAMSAFFLHAVPVRGDLTIVYSVAIQPESKVQKEEKPAAGTNMTLKVKGDKVRVEATPEMTTIFNGTTGEVINLMNDQKMVVRISPEKVKAVTEMINKFSGKKSAPEKPKLTPTGRKEMVNGYETEQYTYEGANFKAICWVALGYPNGAAILAQLQSVKSDLWDAANTKMPDFRDFPGLPIRTQVILAKDGEEKMPGKSSPAQATEITSTITSVNQNPISDSEFVVPSDYKESKLPDIFSETTAAPSASPSP